MLSAREKFFDRTIRRNFVRRFFRRVFLEDWLIKSIALLITVGLWLGVTGFRAPITIRLSDVRLTARFSNNMEITNSLVEKVNIVITGDKRKLDQINKDDLVVLLDLADVTPGDRTVLLTPETVNVALPNGVKLVEVQPNSLPVKLETVEEREIPVRLETEGAVAENFEIYGQTIAPQKARVRGAKSLVRALEAVTTEPIILDNRAADFTARQVILNPPDAKITLLDRAADVSFKIGEKRVEKLFLIPVKTEKKTATVVLYGAQSVLEATKPENLQVETFKTDTGENSMRLILPVDLQDKVEIRKLKISDR